MKFYKVVNPKGHHGLIYKEGLNVDPLPFNPHGDCESGGIYFSREDILAFIGYGNMIYEVTPIGEIYENPGEPKKYKAHEVELKLIGDWIKDINVIKMLVENGADIHANNDAALRHAAYRGHLEVVKYLVEKGADIRVIND